MEDVVDISASIRYFSVTVIKYHDQGYLQKRFFGLYFQRGRVHDGGDSTAADSRQQTTGIVARAASWELIY